MFFFHCFVFFAFSHKDSHKKCNLLIDFNEKHNVFLREIYCGYVQGFAGSSWRLLLLVGGGFLKMGTFSLQFSEK